jgi:hypothetical protein
MDENEPAPMTGLRFVGVRVLSTAPVALVEQGEASVGHCRCSGTQTGPWRGRPPTGRSFRDVGEIYWFTVRDGLIVDWWGLEASEERRRQLRSSAAPR